MKTRHEDLTPRQVQNRVANFIAFTVILSWLFMSWLFYLSTEVKAQEPHFTEVEDIHVPNLTNSKPTDRWRLNSNGFSQRYVHLQWSTKDERVIELLKAYDFSGEEEWTIIKKIAREHHIQPELFVCIMYADSSLGKFLKTTHNYGNVGNNDRGDRVHFESFEQWVNAIGKYALNGKYLKHKYTVDYLSPALWKPGPYYATSPENRHINVTNCLGMIHNKHISDNRKFRW